MKCSAHVYSPLPLIFCVSPFHVALHVTRCRALAGGPRVWQWKQASLICPKPTLVFARTTTATSPVSLLTFVPLHLLCLMWQPLAIGGYGELDRSLSANCTPSSEE